MRILLLLILISFCIAIEAFPFGSLGFGYWPMGFGGGWGGGFGGGWGGGFGGGFGGGKKGFQAPPPKKQQVVQVVQKQPAPTVTKLPPIVRQKIINQDVIQPVVMTQPYLRVHHITKNVIQPQLQKQTVIQPVITQPVVHRVIHQQPIIQQQLQEQTVVKRRVIAQPQLVQHLKTQYQTAPQQTKETIGDALPPQQIPNAKVAAALGGGNGGTNGYALGGAM